MVGKIIPLREEAGQKPYNKTVEEFIGYRSGEGKIVAFPLGAGNQKGWSFLIKESVDKLNEVYEKITKINPTKEDLDDIKKSINGWTKELNLLTEQMVQSTKRYDTRQKYLVSCHPLRAQVMRLPILQLSPMEDMRFVRKYAMEGAGGKVEESMESEWREFLKDFSYGTRHRYSRNVSEYMRAWDMKLFNDEKIPWGPEGGSEAKPAFDWRALSTGKYTWNGGQEVEEPHISSVGLWQFLDKLIDKISGQAEEDKRALREMNSYTSLESASTRANDSGNATTRAPSSGEGAGNKGNRSEDSGDWREAA